MYWLVRVSHGGPGKQQPAVTGGPRPREDRYLRRPTLAGQNGLGDRTNRSEDLDGTALQRSRR